MKLQAPWITSQSALFVRIFAENFPAIQYFYNSGLATIVPRFNHAYGEWLLQEVGTHQQLLARKGLYYALYRQQDASTN